MASPLDDPFAHIPSSPAPAADPYTRVGSTEDMSAAEAELAKRKADVEHYTGRIETVDSYDRPIAEEYARLARKRQAETEQRMEALRQRAPVADPSALGEAARGFARGTATGIEALGGAAEFFGGYVPEPLREATDYITSGVTSFGRDMRRDTAAPETSGFTALDPSREGLAGRTGRWASGAMGEGIASSMPTIAAALMGGLPMGAAISTAQGQGQMYNSLREAFKLEGINATHDQMAPYVLTFGSAIGALDSITELAALSPVKKAAIVASIPKLIAKRIAQGVATESVTEVLQEALEIEGVSRATGVDSDPEKNRARLLDAGAAGAVPGAGFGAGRGVREAVAGAPSPSPDVVPEPTAADPFAHIPSVPSPEATASPTEAPVAPAPVEGPVAETPPAVTPEAPARAVDDLGFYSAALEAAKEWKQPRGTPQQAIKYLKSRGVKDAEIEATGLEAFLADKKSVTREELSSFLEQNRTRLLEATYARDPASWDRVAMENYGVPFAELRPYARDTLMRIADKGENTPKFATYSLDSANPTYVERVVHLPGKTSQVDVEAADARRRAIRDELREIDREYPTPSQMMNAPAEVQARREALARESNDLLRSMVSEEDKDFNSGHFPQPNIVGHYQASVQKDSSGNNVFALSQIQSDWGQAVRDGGVRNEEKIADLTKRKNAAEEDVNKAITEAGGIRDLGGYNPQTWPESIVKAVERFELLSAELRTAESGVPAHPLTKSTDQWTNTTLRRAIKDAVDSGAQSIAIPSGQTVLSYNPGDEHGMQEFYDKIVPKNLSNLLRKMDPSVKPTKTATLKSHDGSKDLGKGFTVFPITDKVREAVGGGQPMFAAGIERIIPSLERGKAYQVPLETKNAMLDALRPVMHMVPPGTDVGALRGLVPTGAMTTYQGKPTPLVRVTAVTPDGSTFRVNLALEYLRDSRAARLPAGHTSTGNPGIIFFEYDTFEGLAETVRGELWHESVHDLRRQGLIPDADWARLLAHSNALQTLHTQIGTYLDMIHYPRANKNDTRTLAARYESDYAGRADFQESIDQESVAHMLEAIAHGQLHELETRSIQDLIAKFADGVYARNAETQAENQQGIAAAAGPMSALNGEGGLRTPAAALDPSTPKGKAYADLMAGRSVIVPNDVVMTVLNVAGSMNDMVPSDVLMTTIVKIEPYNRSGIVARAKRLIGGNPREILVTTRDIEMVERQHLDFLDSWASSGAYYTPKGPYVGGQPLLAFNGVALPPNPYQVLRGQIAHEGLHALWHRIPLDVRKVLLNHGLNVLDVLETDFKTAFERAGMDTTNVSDQDTLGEAYSEHYDNRSDKMDVMAQEVVAWMMEWHAAGGIQISDPDVRQALDDILAGAYRDAEPSTTDFMGDPVFALNGEGGQRGRKTPPVAPGKVRMYHGGANDDTSGGRWFTTDLKYAQGYADKSADGKVSYVDIPETHPAVTPEYADQGPKQGFTFAAELPESIAKNRKTFNAGEPAKGGQRPQSALSVIRAFKGIRDPKGELRAVLGRPSRGTKAKGNQKGYLVGVINNKSGVPMDRAREILIEKGFLPQDADLNDMYNLIERMASGERVVAIQDQDAEAEFASRNAEAVDREETLNEATAYFEELQLPYNLTPEEENRIVDLRRGGMPIDDAIERAYQETIDGRDESVEAPEARSESPPESSQVAQDGPAAPSAGVPSNSPVGDGTGSGTGTAVTRRLPPPLPKRGPPPLPNQLSPAAIDYMRAGNEGGGGRGGPPRDGDGTPPGGPGERGPPRIPEKPKIDVEPTKSLLDRYYGLGRRLMAWYNPITGIPGFDQYLLGKYRTLGSIDTAEDVSKLIHKGLKDASHRDVRATYDYLTTRDADPNTIANQKARDTAVYVKTVMDMVGRALVERGLLTEESYQKYRGEYLPRLYLKHLIKDKKLNLGLSGGTRPSKMPYLKSRDVDLDAEVRALLGEVKDPAFLASRGIFRPLRDIAILDFLKEISKDNQWVFRDSLVPYNGKEVSPYYLRSEAVALRDRAVLAEGENPNVAKQMREEADKLDRAAAPYIQKEQKVPEGYDRIPDTARYGMLRGMLVRKEIKADLLPSMAIIPDDAPYLQQFFKQGGGWQRLNSYFKAMKVPLNPPTQIRNFMSNIIMMNLSGIPAHRIPVLFGRAVKDIVKNGEYWRFAKSHGLKASGFSEQELGKVAREYLKIERQMAIQGKAGYVMYPATVIRQIVDAGIAPFSTAYQFVEAMGKMAKMIDAHERQDLPLGHAYLEAQKWLFDYNTIPSWVRYMRNAPMGMPFVTFSYLALPRIIETAATKPWRMAPYVAIPFVLAEIFKLAHDVDDDDLDKLWKTLPEWLRKNPNAAILPYKDAKGRWQAYNYGYLLPWGQFQDAAMDMRRGEPLEAMKTIGVLGGPATQLVVGWKTGIDAFTGRPIFDKSDPKSVKWDKTIEWFKRMALPPLLTDQSALKKMWDAMKDKPTKGGDPPLTGGQAAMRLLGQNIYPLEPEIQRQRNISRMRKEIRDIEIKRKYETRDKSLTPAERTERMKTYNDFIKEKRDELKKYMKESQIPEKLRTDIRRPKAEATPAKGMFDDIPASPDPFAHIPSR